MKEKLQKPRRSWHLTPKQKWHSTIRGAKDYDRKAGKEALRKELDQ